MRRISGSIFVSWLKVEAHARLEWPFALVWFSIPELAKGFAYGLSRRNPVRSRGAVTEFQGSGERSPRALLALRRRVRKLLAERVELGLQGNELLVERGDVTQDRALFRSRLGGMLLLVHFGVHLVHAVHHDADEEVQHDHRADEDEADEVGRRREGRGLLRGVVHVPPVVERDHLEKREQGGSEISEMDGGRLAKHVNARDGIDVEDQPQQQSHVTDGTEALDKRADEELQLRQGCDEPQEAQGADEAQHRGKRPADWEHADRDNEEIEDIPAIAEVIQRAASMGEKLQHDLNDEDGENRDIEEVQERAVAGDECAIRLHAGEDARKEDGDNDDSAEET